MFNFINEAGRRQFGISALEDNVNLNEIAYDPNKQKELLEMPIFKSMDHPNRQQHSSELNLLTGKDQRPSSGSEFGSQSNTLRNRDPDTLELYELSTLRDRAPVSIDRYIDHEKRYSLKDLIQREKQADVEMFKMETYTLNKASADLF